MNSTNLDEHTALIVIDLQKGGIAAPVQPVPMDDVIDRSSRLASAFRVRNLPVVLVNVAGKPPGRSQRIGRPTHDRPPDWTEIVPAMNQQPTDHVVTKHALGAFTNTDLERYLKEHKVTQVVFSGWATSIGVESTARQAFDQGFNVLIAVDAITDIDEGAHTNSLTKIFPLIGEMSTTQEIIDSLSISQRTR